VQSGVHCCNCGYDLTGAVIGGLCPECGGAVNPAFKVHTLPTSGRAIASLVLGIVSIPMAIGCYGLFGIVCGILAIVFWNVTKTELANGTRGGSSVGLAKAGLICGIIGLSIGVLIMLVIAVAIFAGAN